MLKIIRKEVLAHQSRFWDHSQEALKLLNSPEAKEKAELPEIWRQDVHDLNLLQAVAKEGLQVLNRLKGNNMWSFEDIYLNRKKLMRRLEQLCFFFKKLLPKYKKIYEAQNAKTGGDMTLGKTKINLQRRFTKIQLERDLEGNIIYPITVTP